MSHPLSLQETKAQRRSMASCLVLEWARAGLRVLCSLKFLGCCTLLAVSRERAAGHH